MFFYQGSEYEQLMRERERIQRKYARRINNNRYAISIFKVIGVGLCFFSALLMASIFMAALS